MARYDTYIVTDDGQRIDFRLDVSRRRKNASLDVSEGVLTVRVPQRFSKEGVRRFILDNLQWVERAQESSRQKSGLPERLVPGEKVRLLGVVCTIAAEKGDRYAPPRIESDRLIVSVTEGCGDDYVSAQISRFIRDLAAREIRDSIDRFAPILGLFPNKVTVKSMSASWGRCSSSGNISVNYKIVTYPKECIDYVCIHELCHLRHMDHSPEFWALVGTCCPEWKRIRRSLRS
ncbi:MAG: M48 family metallopeptidase [Ruminococcus sp.]|nr:M48 family metallopeptidase [Ruminococcus sp.]